MLGKNQFTFGSSSWSSSIYYLMDRSRVDKPQPGCLQFGQDTRAAGVSFRRYSEAIAQEERNQAFMDIQELMPDPAPDRGYSRQRVPLHARSVRSVDQTTTTSTSFDAGFHRGGASK